MRNAFTLYSDEMRFKELQRIVRRIDTVGAVLHRDTSCKATYVDVSMGP